MNSHMFNLGEKVVPRNWFSAAMAVLCAFSTAAPGVSAQETVGQWKRFEIVMENPDWEGNPFDIELRGIFRGPGGRTLEQWGFYAGDGVWKVYFMPDETGEWSFETVSDDPGLKGLRGEFQCVPSDLPGKLAGDGPNWILTGRGGTLPVIWNPPVSDEVRWGFRAREAGHPTVIETLDLAADTVGARVLGFDALLIAPIGWAADFPQSAVPYVVGEEGVTFHLPFWDRLNAKLDAARDRGMGHYIMFYSDDELAPDRFGLEPRSEREIRFFRYALARLACYPIVLWDSGIDIGEYRSDEWIDWFVEWIRGNDPWDHPVGSRTGGGSGGKVPAGATYYSTGGAVIPAWRELARSFRGFAERRSIPVAHTDHWRPFHTRGDWTHEKIRIVHWRCALAGGQALYPDYNQGDVVWDEVANRGAPWIGAATRFFRDRLEVDMRELIPDDDWAVSGNAIAAASAGREYAAYLEEGGEVELDLSSAEGAFEARWYNPREGGYEGVPIGIADGEPNRFAAPTEGPGEDWVLHVRRVVSGAGNPSLHGR